MGALGEMCVSNADPSEMGETERLPRFGPKRIEREGESGHMLLSVKPRIYLKPALFQNKI